MPFSALSIRAVHFRCVVEGRSTSSLRLVLSRAGMGMQVVALVAGLGMPAAKLGAQTCTTDDPPCPPNEAPRVFITEYQTDSSQRDVRFHIAASDDEGLDRYTW